MNVNKMIAVVQHYINVRKNAEVNISVSSVRDVMLLNQAYNDAINYFEYNNLKIDLV